MSRDRYLAIAVAFSLGALLVLTPTLASVFVNEPVSIAVGNSSAFAVLSNQTSPLATNSALVNPQGTVANITVSGTWSKSNDTSYQNITGYIALDLNAQTSAYTFVRIASYTGNTSISEPRFYINSPSGGEVLEAYFTNGVPINSGTPVQFGSDHKLNFTLSFQARSSGSKILYIYTQAVVLDVITYTPGSSPVYLHETINMALNEKVLG